MQRTTLLIALMLAATAIVLAPAASSSPPTCGPRYDMGHALVDYVECVRDCLRGQNFDAWPNLSFYCANS